MPFVPNTYADHHEMLQRIGVEKFEDLLNNIPSGALFKGEMKLPAPLSELEVLQHLNELAKKNQNCEENICFLGGGAYDHFIPSAVKHILSRSEFYTAYTPYQPEVAQGTLQAIFEYQSMICELTGMDVANASMYDGGSALAEAALLASAHTNRPNIIVSSTVNPLYVKIVRTLCRGRGIRVENVEWQDGVTNLDALGACINDQTAAVLVQHPNFFGCLEPVQEIAQMAHAKGALFISSNDPLSLSLLHTPKSYGADIATGEGQCLGNTMSFGGPYLGIFAATSELIRKMPGRIAGMTIDRQGRQGFVLTLQTREQHIRRDKATSNICTNQALNALAATVYLALMGKNGLEKTAELCLQKSHYMAKEISKLAGFKLRFSQPFFKEFVIEAPVSAASLINKLADHHIFAGVPLGRYDSRLDRCFLCAVTEKRSRQEIDRAVQIIKEQL
jgi:glycine dehydrogenase subunit 1